jgi:NADH-quinone oxidoreductase subunit A
VIKIKNLMKFNITRLCIIRCTNKIYFKQFEGCVGICLSGFIRNSDQKLKNTLIVKVVAELPQTLLGNLVTHNTGITVVTDLIKKTAKIGDLGDLFWTNAVEYLDLVAEEITKKIQLKHPENSWDCFYNKQPEFVKESVGQEVKDALVDKVVTDQLPIDHEHIMRTARLDYSEELQDCVMLKIDELFDATIPGEYNEETIIKHLSDLWECFYSHHHLFRASANQIAKDTLTKNFVNLSANFEELWERFLVTLNVDKNIWEILFDFTENNILSISIPSINDSNIFEVESVKLYDKQEILTDEKLKFGEFTEQCLNNNTDYSYLDFDFGSSVLIEYLPIVVALIFALFLSCSIVIFSYFLTIQNPEIEKISTYECGFEPYEDARHKVGVKFYIFAILFIIFDVETMYLIPWCVSLSITNYVGYWIMIDFLFELGVSFLYVWLVGGLDWD